MKSVLWPPCRWVRSLALASGLAACGFAASAQIVEFDFTGTTSAAYGGVTNGQWFAATLVVDYAKLTLQATDGSFYDNKEGPIGSPAAVTGVIALSGGAVVSVGPGAGGNNLGESELQRNYASYGAFTASR